MSIPVAVVEAATKRNESDSRSRKKRGELMVVYVKDDCCFVVFE